MRRGTLKSFCEGMSLNTCLCVVTIAQKCISIFAYKSNRLPTQLVTRQAAERTKIAKKTGKIVLLHKNNLVISVVCGTIETIYKHEGHNERYRTTEGASVNGEDNHAR